MTNKETDLLLEECLASAARLLNAPSAKEIVFGGNMTTLTFGLSRALGRQWKAGDEILVTRLDHDANVSPWVLAARDAGAVVKKVDVRVEDATLDMADLERHLSARTRLVAVTAASNLTGSLVDIAAVSRLARRYGALVFVDAVHAAPHLKIDVQAWDCDFLVCSAYKFFGPHIGILWGRTKLLETIEPYKLRPCSNELPSRWMTGTQNYAGLAGVKAAIEYIEEVGMPAIREHERELVSHLLEALSARPEFKVWGVKNDLARRAPTVAVTSDRRSPKQMAERLAAEGIFAWSGNNYALELSERLGLEGKGGVLRLGLMHYNTHEEIERTMAALSSH